MIITNALWMIFEKASRLVIGVAVSAMLARYLGPNGFGCLNYSIALLSIATVLSSLGLNRLIVREVVNHLNDKYFCQVTVASCFYMRLAVSLLILLSIILIAFISVDEQILYTAVIFVSLLFISFDVFDFYAQGLSEFRIISICRLSSFIITSLLKVAFVFYGGTLLGFIGLVVLEYALTALFFYVFFVHSKKINWRINNDYKQRAEILVSESWPEIVAGFGAILFMRLDQIFLQLIAGSESVGIYSAATRITEAWYFLPTAIVSATFPKLLDIKKVSYKKYYDGIQLLTSILVMLSLLVAGFFTLSASWIVNLLFGGEYSQSASVIVLHTWGAIFLCMGISSGSWLVAEKKLKLNLLRNIFGLGVSATANYLLIPKYGVTGSAVSTVLGLSAAFYFFDLLHPELRQMFFLKCRAFSPFNLYHLINSRSNLLNESKINI
ncbi:flippase [Kistimonas scapharcae]|uniref:Flippase n=1 Tax=Kistimonas scapharcae TaxID=1036133 RepID=A0ABP8UYC2_9GAMM